MGNLEALWGLGTPEHSVDTLLSGPGQHYLVNQEGWFCWKPDLQQGQSYLRIQVKCRKSLGGDKRMVFWDRMSKHILCISPPIKSNFFFSKIALIFWRRYNKTQRNPSAQNRVKMGADWNPHFPVFAFTGGAQRAQWERAALIKKKNNPFYLTQIILHRQTLTFPCC